MAQNLAAAIRDRVDVVGMSISHVDGQDMGAIEGYVSVSGVVYLPRGGFLTPDMFRNYNIEGSEITE